MVGIHTQGIHVGDQAEVAVAQHVVGTGIARRPVKLLSVHFDHHGVGGCRLHNVVPNLETVNDQCSQHNGGNDRPDKFQRVVDGVEIGLAGFTVTVAVGKIKQEEIRDDENDADDVKIHVQELVGDHAVFGGGNGQHVFLHADRAIGSQDESEDAEQQHHPCIELVVRFVYLFLFVVQCIHKLQHPHQAYDGDDGQDYNYQC